MFSFQDSSEISSAGKDGQISARFSSMSAPVHALRIGKKEEMLSAYFFLTNTSRAAIFPCTASAKNGSGGTPAAPDRRIRAASDAVSADKKRRKHGPRPSLVSASLTSLINGQMGAGSVRPPHVASSRDFVSAPTLRESAPDWLPSPRASACTPLGARLKWRRTASFPATHRLPEKSPAPRCPQA